MLKKILSIAGLGILVLVSLLGVGVTVRQHRKFEAPTPTLQASTDPAAIARGRYLVNGPAHCVSCHGETGKLQAALKEKQLPADDIALQGGFVFNIPPGAFYVPNITNDATGIGHFSDGEVARMMRFGVRPDGEAALPFMPFQNLADDDVVAILSYLRAQPAVKNVVPPHQYNLLGKMVKAFVLKPEGPTETPPAKAPIGPTIEYGRYLAHSVANCNGCHTLRDFRTGTFIGQPFAGCNEMPSDTDPNVVFHTQNITPSAKGKIAGWSEDVFLARFRTARTIDGSPMPWESFRRMTDEDVRAIYRYLQTVKPVDQECPPPMERKS